MSTRVVALTALCAGGAGLSLAPMSLSTRAFPAPGPRAPGWTCYSPPWARPALALSATLLAASLVGLILAAASNPAGAWVLFGLVGVGSLGIAVVFTTGENGPSFSEDEPQNP